MGRSASVSSDESARRGRHKRHKSDKPKKEKKAKKESSSRRRRLDRSDSEASSDDERSKRKQRKRAEKMLASFGYTNDTNPFGDSNLSQPFVWGKKYDEAGGSGGGKGSSKDGKKKATKPSEKELKQQQLDRMEEIKKARKRREEREAEKEEMERLKNEELRLRDAEQYEDWQQKEEDFHLNQAKVRSKLRIKEKREKPVDLLAKNLLLVAQQLHKEDEVDLLSQEGGVRVEKRRPHAIVEVLSMNELEELRENITAYLDLEGERGENKEFWTLMMLICRDRIRRLKRSQSESGTERGAIHDSVNDTITDMLQGKNKAELDDLKKDVSKTIASAETSAGVDVEFWEEVSQQIDVYLARARLTALHEDMLEKLRDLIERYETAGSAGGAAYGGDARGGSGDRDESREAMQMESNEAHKELEESEEKMGVSEEVALPDADALPAWSEKYMPRKPRYFNRVKTGYDWNKYNQTHYDHDNPPPKVVQGYKFNLFYPDLIDKVTAPRFFLEKSSSSDFCIIRFSAGPPYQDIAFKIVNREWEYSHKRGFKSVFERGILHLYFNFKRHRYRR